MNRLTCYEPRVRRNVVLAASLLLACATPTSEKDAVRETAERPVRATESAAMPTAAFVGAPTSAERPSAAAPQGSAASRARAVPHPVGAGTPAHAASSPPVAVAPSAIPDEPPPPAVFACPMHPEVRAASAVKCSKCGMPLEPVNSK